MSPLHNYCGGDLNVQSSHWSHGEGGKRLYGNAIDLDDTRLGGSDMWMKINDQGLSTIICQTPAFTSPPRKNKSPGFIEASVTRKAFFSTVERQSIYTRFKRSQQQRWTWKNIACKFVGIPLAFVYHFLLVWIIGTLVVVSPIISTNSTTATTDAQQGSLFYNKTKILPITASLKHLNTPFQCLHSSLVIVPCCTLLVRFWNLGSNPTYTVSRTGIHGRFRLISMDEKFLTRV